MGNHDSYSDTLLPLARRPIEQQEVTLLDEFDGHPSLRRAVSEGDQVISF